MSATMSAMLSAQRGGRGGWQAEAPDHERHVERHDERHVERLSLEPRILIWQLTNSRILSRSRLTNSREINGDPLVLRRCGANRERERGREGERVVTLDGGSGDDGARRVSG
jgi:hypothetical protein